MPRREVPPPDVLDWLMDGDPSVAYMTARDILGEERPELQARIATLGWGAALLGARHPDGHWGRSFYFPKWTSTHYTLLDLANLSCPPVPEIVESVDIVLDEVNAGRPGGRSLYTDTCINGMVLSYASRFGAAENKLSPFVDFLLDDAMPDGGFNCDIRKGAHHSSLHSTVSVLEGFAAYRAAGHSYRASEVDAQADMAREFILIHRFYRSDHTGAVINPDFLKFPVSPRWYYNILRGLDHFRAAGVPFDPRMGDALDVLETKRGADGRWKANAAKSGQRHFEIEKAGKPSRLVTLTALRVLKAYRSEG